jgi:iron(III) transport system ATP-binding protein
VTAVISCRDVTLRLGAADALDRVTLTLAEGEVVALVGPSGAGKTSLVRVLLGLVAPSSGEVEVGGRVVTHAGRIVVPPEERGLGVVFQDLALWPHLDASQHLAFVLRSRRDDPRIAEMLAAVGLAGKEHRHPAALSGGERQRVAIARALVSSPRVLLLDEPLANLDLLLRDELLSLLDRLLRERRTAALHITHDPDDARRLADRLAVLEAGRIVQQGSFADLAARPATPFVQRWIAAAASSRPT